MYSKLRPERRLADVRHARPRGVCNSIVPHRSYDCRATQLESGRQRRWQTRWNREDARGKWCCTRTAPSQASPVGSAVSSRVSLGFVSFVSSSRVLRSQSRSSVAQGAVPLVRRPGGGGKVVCTEASGCLFTLMFTSGKCTTLRPE